MSLVGTLVLVSDVRVVPVTELPEERRARFAHAEGDRVVTREAARSVAVVVDAAGAELIEGFRSPRTVAEAVVAYAERTGLDAQDVLTRAYPLLCELADAGVLVAPEERAVLPRVAVGAGVDGWEVVALCRLVDDTEIHLVRGAGGAFAALKLLRDVAAPVLVDAFAREARILRRLGQTPAVARLCAAGELHGAPYLITSWCAGVPATQAAAEARASGDDAALHRLLIAVADAYAALHEHDVVHGDVHDGNVLVDAQGRPTLLDFAYAAAPGEGAAPRVASPFAVEPELAAAHRSGSPPPPATFAGEQYAVAALLAEMASGSLYLDFSLEPEETWRQVCEDEPRLDGAGGDGPWPELERALRRALAKRPADRHPSMRAFADAVRAAAPPRRAALAGGLPRRALRSPLDAFVDEQLERLAPGGAGLREGAGGLASVALGSAGIVYALLRIARARDDGRVLSLADLWLHRHLHDLAGPRAFIDGDADAEVASCSTHHAVLGALAVRAHLHAAMCPGLDNEALATFAAQAHGHASALDLTLGAAGVLSTAASLHELEPSATLRAAVDAVAAELWAQMAALGPVRATQIAAAVAAPAAWRDAALGAVARPLPLATLGVAHGWAGLLHASLRWCAVTGADGPPWLEARLAELFDHAAPRGRGLALPLELGGSGPAEVWPGWCAGSAGHALLALEAAARFGGAWLELAERLAWSTWEDAGGGGDLCCGLAGQSYALLAVHRAGCGEAWRVRAMELAERACEAVRAYALRPGSLYRGELGVAVLAAEVVRPAVASMPFFETER